MITTQKHLLQICQLITLSDNQWRYMKETPVLRFLVQIGAIERTIKRVNSANDIEYYYKQANS